MNKKTAIILFQEKQIRRVWHNEEWWFVVIDVVTTLTDSVNPPDYIKKMRRRDTELARGWRQIITPLSVETPGGIQKLNCANTEGILRIIQSIPSRKAQLFKCWLAKVGYDRIREIENPALAQERMKQLYELKGYPKDWIDKCLGNITIQENVTNESQESDAANDTDYAILTTEISKATFDMMPSEYKKHKKLPKKSKTNLHDMTDLELIFTLLDEKAATKTAKQEKSDNSVANKKIAKRSKKFVGDVQMKKELREAV